MQSNHSKVDLGMGSFAGHNPPMDPESGSQQAASGLITPRVTDSGENAAMDPSTSSERGDKHQGLREDPRPPGKERGSRRPAEPRPPSPLEVEPQAPAAPTLRLAC